MRKIILLLVAFMIVSCQSKHGTILFPKAPSILSTDTYHGINIEDPYRNLENLNDSLVIKWLKGQGTYASNILNSIPGRQRLIKKQQSYDTKREFALKIVKTTPDGKYFYTKTIGNEKVAKLYYRTDLENPEILLYDPSEYSKEENYIINYIKPDWDGEKIVISLTKTGEEISEMVVMDVKTKKILPGLIKNALASIGKIDWLSDNSGFIYLYSPVIDPTDKNYWMHTKSILYKIGSDPKKLQDIFSLDNNPELKLNPEDFPIVNNYSRNNGYLFALVAGSSSYFDVYFKKEPAVHAMKSKWKPLFKQSDKIKKFVVDNDDNLVFLSAKNASNYRICKTSMINPDFRTPQILVPEKKDLLITKFELTIDGLFYTTKKNNIEANLYYLENDNQEKEIKLPNSTVVGNIYIGSNGPNHKLLRVIATGFLDPAINYFYDVSNNTFIKENLVPVEQYPDFDNLIVESLEIPSHDGVLVPISIIRNKNCKKNGENPTLFFGYGSYGSLSRPTFNPNFLTWVSEGGILVFAHVRGGGEKGDSWHKAGFKTTKPNTWKDMIATTEYLIKEGYTTTAKSAIWGSSAGGILAGRAMTDRPDLYKAVILTSPSTNMVRSEIQPNGKNSIKEFGTVEIKEEFEALLEMDSYHKIKKGVEYPATYVSGGMKDGRVVIWDPAKFIARLQANNAADSPILFRVKFENGHAGINSDKLDQYELYANAFSFALWQMGYPEFQPK